MSPDEKANREAWVGDMREGSTGESEYSRSKALRAPERRGEETCRGDRGDRDCVLGSALCVVCANAQVRSASSLLASLYLTLRCVRKRAGGVRLFRVPTAAP